MGRGRLSVALGEWCDALSRYSVAMGYKAIAGPSDPEDPNYLPDGTEGAAAYAHGYEVRAHGNFALALGAFVEAFNGAMVIGRGYLQSRELSRFKSANAVLALVIMLINRQYSVKKVMEFPEMAHG